MTRKDYLTRLKGQWVFTNVCGQRGKSTPQASSAVVNPGKEEDEKMRLHNFIPIDKIIVLRNDVNADLKNIRFTV